MHLNLGKRIFSALLLILVNGVILSVHADSPKIAYLVSDSRIPFWEIMWRGVENRAEELGYEAELFTSENRAENELKHLLNILKGEYQGLVLSPTNSSNAVTLLRFAREADLPVVISDIGTEDGEYLSYISSNNFQGAYELGKILTERFQSLGWSDRTVGIIAIPQKRANGKARTAGFSKALEEGGVEVAGLLQQVDFSHEETYVHAMDLIQENPNLGALWLQGSDRYQAALDAIADAGKAGEIALICFDAEPEFIDMIREGSLLAAGMQQPFLMGAMAVTTLDHGLQGHTPEPEQKLEVLAVSSDSIDAQLPIIRRNVLGQVSDP